MHTDHNLVAVFIVVSYFSVVRPSVTPNALWPFQRILFFGAKKLRQDSHFHSKRTAVHSSPTEDGVGKPVTLISTHKLDDLGVSSNLIGSLSRGIEHYPLPRDSGQCPCKTVDSGQWTVPLQN